MLGILWARQIRTHLTLDPEGQDRPGLGSDTVKTRALGELVVHLHQTAATDKVRVWVSFHPQLETLMVLVDSLGLVDHPVLLIQTTMAMDHRQARKVLLRHRVTGKVIHFQLEAEIVKGQTHSQQQGRQVVDPEEWRPEVRFQPGVQERQAIQGQT